MSEYELSFMFGLNESQSFHLMVVFELAKRLKYIQNSKDEVIIRSPSDTASLLMDMQHLEKEHFVALYLDTKSKVIGRETIAIGSLTEAIVHPREVYRQAIRRGAYSIIGAHNHPSGDPGPSHEDVKIIQRLVEVGKLVGIKFHDHIIIGRESYRSLCEDGCISLS
nr:DNA repair protein RadC [Paenibacillus solani]